MLGDTSYPSFFPTVFAVVAEILDSFGELVYERVLAKGTPAGGQLPPSFTHADVGEEGVETTRNWFYKVASIRELVPRFYVEIAILKCYRLLMPSAQLLSSAPGTRHPRVWRSAGGDVRTLVSGAQGDRAAAVAGGGPRGGPRDGYRLRV